MLMRTCRYFVSAVEVYVPKSTRAWVIIGDSITDGRGSNNNQNNRLVTHASNSSPSNRHQLARSRPSQNADSPLDFRYRSPQPSCRREPDLIRWTWPECPLPNRSRCSCPFRNRIRHDLRGRKRHRDWRHRRRNPKGHWRSSHRSIHPNSHPH